MLTITIPKSELYNEVDNRFITIDEVVVELEHSLASLSKWESKYQKPFLVPGTKSTEEILGYIEAMILTPGVPSSAMMGLTKENLIDIQKYIDSPQTATTFRQMPGSKGKSEIVTSELVYYWMISANIPLACENWHLNRLFTLIRVFEVKNSKPKKMTKSQLAQYHRDLNAQRRQQLNSTG